MPDRALVLIDFQIGFDNPVWGARNNPDAELRAAALLTHWRRHNLPLFHVQHVSTEAGSPLGPGPGSSFKPEVAPLAGEPIFVKSVNSAFIGTRLEETLRRREIRDLLICGLTTPHCVSTSARMAANLGFKVTLAHDACASFSGNANTSWSGQPPMSPEAIHESAVHHLHGEFVVARSSADILSKQSVPTN